MSWKTLFGGLLLAASLTAPAQAGWRIVDRGETRQVAKSKLYVTATEEWNRQTGRNSAKRGENWTVDGPLLNDLGFFMGIKKGEPLFRESDRKKKPLPKFDPTMLPTDIVEWYEDTANVVLGGSLFAVSDVRPATLAGFPGVHFAYSYTGGDNVERLGEVRAAIIDQKLYMITYDAPKLYYFDRYIAGVRAMMDGASFAKK